MRKKRDRECVCVYVRAYARVGKDGWANAVRAHLLKGDMAVMLGRGGRILVGLDPVVASLSGLAACDGCEC